MVVQPLPLDAPPPVAGRSLWQDAWIRLRRNRAAVASMVVLVLLARSASSARSSAAPLRPRLSAVRARARRASRPTRRPRRSCRRFERELKRTRLDPGEPVLDGSRDHRRGAIGRPIDPQGAALLRALRLFSDPGLDLAEDSDRHASAVSVQRLHFFFGTDANGRDLAGADHDRRPHLAGHRHPRHDVALLIGVSYGAERRAISAGGSTT